MLIKELQELPKIPSKLLERLTNETKPMVLVPTRPESFPWL